MRLPEPIERLLEPGPERLPDPGWDDWVSLGYAYTTAGSPVVKLHYTSYHPGMPARTSRTCPRW
jgi:hypothetical protein